MIRSKRDEARSFLPEGLLDEDALTSGGIKSKGGGPGTKVADFARRWRILKALKNRISWSYTERVAYLYSAQWLTS
jgi:hypothetical protein